MNTNKQESSGQRAAKGQQEPVAWMNPDEPVASDAFRWTQISRAPEYSVPVYRAAPVAQQSEAGAPTVAAEADALQAAYDALRLYVDASDTELAERGISRADALRRARDAELKLIATPTSGRESAAPLAQQDAKDAARWQWLRKQHNSGDEQWFVYGATSADLDADIDDVMQKGGVDNV